MNLGIFFELFKVYFLWDTTRGQKTKLKALIKESLVLGLGVLMFHIISIIATALYVAPYLQNALEGALYSMDMSLKDFNLQNNAVEISFIVGLGLATILEITTTAIASKTIEEWERYRNSFIKNASTLRKWAISLSLLILLQVGTAFGGIVNTIVLLQTDKADRILIANKKQELDNMVQSINILQTKINDIEAGKYNPTKEELTIANSKVNLISSLREQIETINKKLEVAEKAHNEYALKIREAYYKKGFYTKAERKIDEHYKTNVLPLLSKKNELSDKLEKLEAIKTTLTRSEYLNKLKDKVTEMQQERNKLYRHLKILQKKIRKQINIGDGIYFFAIGFALFLVIVQSFLENLLHNTKKKISGTLDALDPSVRAKRAAKREAQQSNKIEDKLRALEQEEKELFENETFMYPQTKKVLDFMKEYYEANNELPSMSITQEKLDLKEYEVKNARRELKANNYFYEKDKKIFPTEKLLEK